jgi:hypothetical protein
VLRLAGSGPQRKIARAGNERAVRGRGARGCSESAIRPALGERRPRDSDANAPNASPPEAQRARLEGAVVVEPEPRLRARLEDAQAAEPEPQAAPCSCAVKRADTALSTRPFLRKIRKN